MGVPDTIFCYGWEIERARRRAGETAWAPSVHALRRAAQTARAEVVPDRFDSSWYDANPQREFHTTYREFHAYVGPAARCAGSVFPLIQAGWILGEEECLEYARRRIVHLAERFHFHVRHHDSGMEYGRIGMAMAEAYISLRSRLETDEIALILRSLEKCGEAVREGTRHWLERLAHMPYNNHLAFQRRALLAIGLALERSDWVGEALEGPRGFGDLLAGALYDDGLCYESSTSYHFATLGALLDMAEAVRHFPALNRDLYQEEFSNGRSLKQMFDAPLGLMLPGGELPPVGDCYAQRLPLWSRAALYELAYAAYRDPRYAWIIRQGGRANVTALLYGADEVLPGDPPIPRTRVWIEHGYALLTCATSDAYHDPFNPAPAAFLGFDRSGIHHHMDRLGLQIAGAGSVWLEDVESRTISADGHGFSAPIQSQFNRTGLAHNLVMIDEESHHASDRPLLVREFRDLPTVKSLTVADLHGILYEGVRLSRSIAVTAEYVLDLVQISGGEQDRTCDLLLHPRADGPADTPALHFSSDALLPPRAPYALLREIEFSPVVGDLTITWCQGEKMKCNARLRVMEGRADRLFKARWPIQSDWQNGGREMFILRARGSRVVFLSLYVIRPVSNNEKRMWVFRAVERVFNGLHDEIHVRVFDGQHERRHVFEGLVG